MIKPICDLCFQLLASLVYCAKKICISVLFAAYCVDVILQQSTNTIKPSSLSDSHELNEGIARNPDGGVAMDCDGEIAHVHDGGFTRICDCDRGVADGLNVGADSIRNGAVSGIRDGANANIISDGADASIISDRAVTSIVSD